MERIQELDPGFFTSYLRRASRSSAQRRHPQPLSRRGCCASPRPGPLAADAITGARGGARSPLRLPAPAPRRLPFFPRPCLSLAGGPGRHEGGPGGRAGPATGTSRPHARTTHSQVTRGNGNPTGASSLSAAVQPPRPARRHVGNQARLLAALRHHAGVTRAPRARTNLFPLGQCRPLQQRLRARGRRTGRSRS